MKEENEEPRMKGSVSSPSPSPALEKKKKKKKKEKEGEREEKEDKKDLKALIHEHSLFFDRLVELIPARFYLPHDDGAGKVWFHGLSKDAKASCKKQSRENLRMARRQRLEASPSSSSVSTLELLKKSIIDKKSTTERERGGDSDAAPLPFTSNGDDERNDGGSVTYEELRQRLHQRIEELRGNRNTRDPAAGGKKGKGGKNQQKNQKRGDLGKGEREMNAGSVEKKPTEKKAEESVGELSFGQVKIAGELVGKKGKKRKGSKVQELERAKRLKQAMDDPEKGARVSKRHSWSAALSRAEGVKVHDDPRLLKQSIKKEKRRQQKSAKKWKERMEVVEKNKAAKQQTRSGHIAERAREKKMRRIAKREKKLMRPGFEGRKNGFINETSTSG
ncbi:uncharacterized protein LOC116251613 [Nymphaea colorata]|nr:uncharacterized protein LOC116251613 [Nymphaea colorata]